MRIDPRKRGAPAATEPIWWWEPRWAFVPFLRVELRRIAAVHFWFRLLVIGLIATILVLLGYRLLVPGGPFLLPAWQLTLVGLYVPVTLLLWVGFLFLVPPLIEVHPSGMQISRGGMPHRIPRDRLLSAQIDASDLSRCKLIIRYTAPRGRERTRALGIPPKVDLAALGALFGDKLVLKDAKDVSSPG